MALFSGQTLLVTGASGGEGEAIARRLGEEGATVCLSGRAGVSQYAATKHALTALADSLCDECNPSGVRVFSLFLGSTATPMQAAVRVRQKRAYDSVRLIQPDDVAEMVAAVLALPRTAEVTDVVMRPAAKV